MSIKNSAFTCSKLFKDYPCCHRQWKHPGHCHFVHGYSRSFKIWFASNDLDDNGFVVDFSSLRMIEKKLRQHFDHTFLVNADDPLMSTWKQLDKEGALDLRVMRNVGMEGTSKLVWEWSNSLLFEREIGRSCCWRVDSSENEYNSARFECFPEWFKTPL